MPHGRPSEWPALFDIAVQLLSHVRETTGHAPAWSFGGGTALMLQIDHRESHDIDLFLGDPQILPYLNPETQGITLDRQPDSYSTTATVLKLTYDGLGEIDFICCADITATPNQWCDVRGHDVALELPSEIVAKKVYYRGWNFQPRDMFDLAAVAEHCGNAYVINALKECGVDECAKALRTIEKTTPAAVEAINRQLMVRDATAHLAGAAREVSMDLLRQALEVG